MNEVKLEMREGVAWITIDDGKVNALGMDKLAAIKSHLAESERNNAQVVLKGRPGIFSAGFDLKVLGGRRDQQVELLSAGMDLIVTFLRHPHPITCLCTGHAYPMGAFLMLCSDYRIGVEGNWKIGMNEVAIGITVPPFALALANHRLTRPGIARVGTAAMMSPGRAMEYGYLDEVVADTELDAVAQRVLAEFAKLDLPSYVATKQAMNKQVIQEVIASKSMFD
ncbi:MAG: crotonase/enoyl-CoA hydratase family protein [Pseudomonadales bacterium]